MTEKKDKPSLVKPPVEIDKSRNLLGFNIWSDNFPLLKAVMFILGWFTVPIEVFFRRDFGQRWLTGINFYVGLMVLMTFTVIQTLATAMSSASSFGTPQPPETFSLWESIMGISMYFFLLAYIALSSYHFFRIWWRNGTNTALHSFADGTSRFEGLAVYLMRVINAIAVPMIALYMLFLPEEERERKVDIPPLLNDVTAFTNTIFEPLVLLVLAFIFPGTARVWLLISVPALAVYASWKETAKLDKALDFRDSIISAEMTLNRQAFIKADNALKTIMQQAAVTLKKNPEVVPLVGSRYPDLTMIIEEMNREKVEK